MEHVGDTSAKIRAFAERMVKLCEDPEYQRNQERIATENAEAEARSREAERNLRLHSAGIPRTLWEPIRAPRDEAALIATRSFLETPAAFLVLAGPKGRGKTFALCWAAAERGGRYLWAGDLVHAGLFDSVWEDLASTPLLALDELGAEYLNDAYVSALYNLLDKRYANGRKTVLATNLDGPSFRTRYCSGGMERLYERLKTAGTWAPLEGESMRKHWTDTDDQEDEP